MCDAIAAPLPCRHRHLLHERRAGVCRGPQAPPSVSEAACLCRRFPCVCTVCGPFFNLRVACVCIYLFLYIFIYIFIYPWPISSCHLHQCSFPLTLPPYTRNQRSVASLLLSRSLALALSARLDQLSSSSSSAEPRSACTMDRLQMGGEGGESGVDWLADLVGALYSGKGGSSADFSVWLPSCVCLCVCLLPFSRPL